MWELEINQNKRQNLEGNCRVKTHVSGILPEIKEDEGSKSCRFYDSEYSIGKFRGYKTTQKWRKRKRSPERDKAKELKPLILHTELNKITG